MALLNFDANSIEPQSFDALPAGFYNAIITDSEWGENKTGNGRHLKLTFQIFEGEYKGRKVFTRLNLEHSNTQTVEIARQNLSAICRAVAVMKPNDSCELHNLPMCIKVICKKNEQTGELYNEIKDFKPRNTTQPGTAQPDSGSNNTAPWKR